MIDFWQHIHSYVQAIDPYFGVVALIPILLTFWEVWFGRRRRHKKWFAEVRQASGPRPAILIVDILPGREIVAQVENHRRGTEGLQKIPDDRVFRIDAASLGVTSPELSSEVMIAFANKVHETAADIYRAGTGVIHYFHSGPLPTVAVVAAALANGPRVLMYHWRQGHYESWGPIRHPGEV